VNTNINKENQMIEVILLTLALLFVKHWYVDFVNQDEDEVKHKGIYLHWIGVRHSLKHGLITAFIFSFVLVDTEFALLLGMADFLLHYHIDWIKMNYSNRDITTPQFWNHLGLDQLAHYLVYLGLVWVMV
jgi:hypothetical protein